MSQRVELTALYPQMPGETEGWTDRVLSHSKEHGTNRQCSIGWHDECSDPAGNECNCICHDRKASIYSVEGHAEAGIATATRSEEGKQHWPPVPGEPESAWAHWIWAYSTIDATARALAKQRVLLGITPKVEPERAGITLTRDQLEAWACRTLTDEEVEALDMAVPDSSIPEAIGTIADSLADSDD